MEDEILVSICCITYNHEKYIRDALDGFLMQKTNFKYEIVVHDDASTDNTANIIREYEKKYPDIIKPIYQKENQFQKGNKATLITYSHAKGKYIALCEGDDYWTDENKLQLQVDYMEANEECTFCFHNAIVDDLAINKQVKFIPYEKENRKFLKKDAKYNVGELELLGFIPTASFMFRNENVKKLPEWIKKCHVGDKPLKLVMTSFGHAHYIDRIMSVYRKNVEGSRMTIFKKEEEKSIEKKIYYIEKNIECIDYIDEFTDFKYKENFEYARAPFVLNKLFFQKREKEILKSKYFKYLDFSKKIKYLIKIFCPFVTKMYKFLKEKVKKRK